MTKLEVIGASVAMALLVASPAAADTANNENFGVQSEFFGTDTVQFGGADNGFDGDLFDDDDVFDNSDFDDDVFDNDNFDDDVFDD